MAECRSKHSIIADRTVDTNMPNVVRGSQVTKEIVTKKVVTKNGEVKLDINLHLDININAEGVKVSASTLKAQQADDDEINWAIPDFGGEKLQFGKQVED